MKDSQIRLVDQKNLQKIIIKEVNPNPKHESKSRIYHQWTSVMFISLANRIRCCPMSISDFAAMSNLFTQTFYLMSDLKIDFYYFQHSGLYLKRKFKGKMCLSSRSTMIYTWTTQKFPENKSGRKLPRSTEWKQRPICWHTVYVWIPNKKIRYIL